MRSCNGIRGIHHCILNKSVASDPFGLVFIGGHSPFNRKTILSGSG